MSEKNLLIVFYGDGKGKTCAAIGLALRVAGHNRRVIFVHFIKRDLGFGEYLALKRVPNIIYVALGPGLGASREEIIEKSISGLNYVESIVKSIKPYLVVLDELGVVIVKYGLNIDYALDKIKTMLDCSHVLVTGKYMPREIIDLADLATEFRNVKHYYARLGKPVEGLDY